MGCRCYDIARCQRDLSAMGGVVSPNVNAASNYSAQISQSMRTGAQGVGDAVSTATIEAVEAQLGRLNAKSEGLSQELCAECGREMQRLSALLSQMIGEDQAHHAAEAAAAAARG